MNRITRLLVALIGAFLTFNGLRLVFLPHTAAIDLFVSASGPAGLSTVRGDLGGTFFALGVTILVGLHRSANPTLLIVPAMIIASIAFARLVGFAFDGVVFHSIVAFAAEILFASIIIAASRGSSVRATD